MFYNCFGCQKVALLDENAERKCPLCGSQNGEVASAQRVEDGLKGGVSFNIDPKTGKRAKS